MITGVCLVIFFLESIDKILETAIYSIIISICLYSLHWWITWLLKPRSEYSMNKWLMIFFVRASPGVWRYNPPAMQEPPNMWVPSLDQEYPLGRKWQLTPVLLSGESHRQRSLADYSPWSFQRVRHDWSDLSHTHIHTIFNNEYRFSLFLFF